jgi:hypothetical protein
MALVRVWLTLIKNVFLIYDVVFARNLNDWRVVAQPHGSVNIFVRFTHSNRPVFRISPVGDLKGWYGRGGNMERGFTQVCSFAQNSLVYRKARTAYSRVVWRKWKALGLVSFPTGDSGSTKQTQFASKLIFK